MGEKNFQRGLSVPEAPKSKLPTLQRWSVENSALTMREAMTAGQTIREARALDFEAVNVALIRELRQLAEALEVKVTFRSAVDYEDGLAVVHSFYGINLEEVRTVCAMIRRGELAKDKLYERFKARELRMAFTEYMGKRAEERNRHQYKHVHGDIETQMAKPLNLSQIADDLDLPETEPRTRRGQALRMRDILAGHGKETNEGRQQGSETTASTIKGQAQAHEGENTNQAAK